MFTSNGLICLSGVIMCRIRGFPIGVSSPCLRHGPRARPLCAVQVAGLQVHRFTTLVEAAKRLNCRGLPVSPSVLLDLGAFIMTPGQIEAEARVPELGTEIVEPGLALGLRGHKSKAGGPPGTLAKPGDAFVSEPVERGTDAWAGIGASLQGREIATHAGLQRADMLAEPREVACGESGQRALHDSPAQLFRLALRKVRQRLEGLSLASPGKPACLAVEDQDHAPFRGEGEAAHELGQTALPGAAVEHGAALCEGGDPDPRPRTSAKPRCDRRRLKSQSL